MSLSRRSGLRLEGGVEGAVGRKGKRGGTMGSGCLCAHSEETRECEMKLPEKKRTE